MIPPLVQRFLVRAVPFEFNRKYRGFEPAKIGVLIRENDRHEGLRKMQEVLKRERWQLLELVQHDKLIEQAVQQEGGFMLEAFLHARKHGDWLTVFPENFGAGKRKDFCMLGPKITEPDIDLLIESAGGQRFIPPGQSNNLPKNADYVLSNHVVELKEVQENALEKPDRQRRLAALFHNVLPDSLTVPLNPDLLVESDRIEFYRILAEPIARQLKSASKQIKSTKTLLGRDDLIGGVILINSGTDCLYHELFCDLAVIEVSRYKGVIEELCVISTWFLTNGMDNELFFAFHPNQPENDFQRRLATAFDKLVDDKMNGWAQGGFVPDGASIHPQKPIGFEFDGRIFAWEPARLSESWRERSSD